MCKQEEIKVGASDIEVSLNLAKYNRSRQDICYIDRVKIMENGRIQFSILIQIKQKRAIKEQELKLELLYFKEPQREDDEDEEKKESTSLNQQISRLQLQSIPLFREKEEGVIKRVPIRDAWKIRQDIKLNLSEVPVKGVGNYAIVAYLGNVGEKEMMASYPAELFFLDCVYFEVAP